MGTRVKLTLVVEEHALRERHDGGRYPGDGDHPLTGHVVGGEY